MKIPWCERCGSRNHFTMDCSKPGRYVPTAADLAELQPQAAEPVTVAAAPKKQEPMFEPVPRFKGAPPICTATNQLAFKSEEDVKKWVNSFDGFHLKKVWLCKDCKHWHHEATQRGPSGSSSGGHERQSGLLPKGFVPFMRKRLASRFDDELPVREVMEEPVAEPKKVAKPKAKAQVVKQANELF